MSKLTRVLQKIFGSTAGTDEIAQIGSLAAGTPAFTTDPATIQALGNYLQGWYGVVLANNSPAIEDVNALDFLITRQLAYIFQAGIPEYDATTVYYKGSLVNSGGLAYASLTDANTGNAVTDATNWRTVGGPGADQVVVGTAPYCTHATLAAAVADSAVGTNVTVLLTESANVSSVINLTKAGWRIRALPGVTYTKSGSPTKCISCQAARIEIERLRISGFSTAGNVAVEFTAAGTYGRVLFSNFVNCDTEVDDSAVAGGAKAVTLGNITE